MDYNQYPIFSGITKEASEYLDGFDIYLRRQGLSFDIQDLLLRKIDLYYTWLDEKYNAKDIKKFQSAIYHEYELMSKTDRVRFPFLEGLIYDARRQVKNMPLADQKSYFEMINKWKTTNHDLNVSVGSAFGGAGWIYKTSPKYTEANKQNKKVHRFVLNVDPNLTLLNRLDEFAVKYGCQYKCAESENIAYNRPDTIVVYTADDRFAEQVEELQNIIKYSVRKNGDKFLDGDRISAGIYTAKEPDRNDIENVAKESQTICPRLAEYLRSILKEKSEKKHPLSLGQFQIYKDICVSMKIQKQIETILHDGIKMPRSDGGIRVVKKQQPKNHPNTFVFENYDKQGKILTSLKIDEKGLYVGQNYRTGIKYSNDPKLIKMISDCQQLSNFLLGKYKIYIQQAIDIAYSQIQSKNQRNMSDFAEIYSARSIG